MKSIEEAPRAYAQLAGWIYLAIILLGLFGEAFVRGSIVTSDPAATLRNVAAAEGLWRAGIAGDLLMHVLDVPVIVIFYFLLRPVSVWLAALATLLNIVQTSVLVANKLTLIVPLLALSGGRATSLSPDALNAIAYTAISLHGYGFGVGLIFFAFATLVRGYLVFNSGYFPKVLGILLGLAGVSYLINSEALLLAPSLASAMFPLVLLPAFVGELSMCLWLIVKGIRVDAWRRRLAASGPVGPHGFGP